MCHKSTINYTYIIFLDHHQRGGARWKKFATVIKSTKGNITALGNLSL